MAQKGMMITSDQPGRTCGSKQLHHAHRSCPPSALALAFVLFALPCQAATWTVRVGISDASASNPPAGLVVSAYCTYRYGHPDQQTEQCGNHLPLDQDVVLSVPETPDYISFYGDVTEDNLTRSDYWGLLERTYPHLDTRRTDTIIFANHGNIYGYVRTHDGVPLADVTVAVYSEFGTPIRTAVTDASGRYEFEREGATQTEIERHWILDVGFGFGIGSSLYYLTASSIGAQTPAPFDKAHPALLYSSEFLEVDILLGQPEANQNPNGKGGGGNGGNEQTPEDGSGGRACEPQTGVGEPVDVVTGSMYLDQTDAVLPGIRRTLAFERHYRSERAFHGLGGAFGRGWEHSFEKSVTVVVPDRLIRLDKGDGVPVYFSDVNGDGTYPASLPATETSWIAKVGNTYTRHFHQGGLETYDEGGRLASQVDRVGNVTTVGRDELGRITSITAPGGRALTLTYEGDLVTSLSGPDGRIVNYSYEGPLLRGVSYPDASGYTFQYDPDGQVLAVSDATGRVRETHTYSGGRALTTEISNGREKYTLSYSHSVLGGMPFDATTVTDAIGNVRSFYVQEFTGIKEVTQITGPCPSCGGGNVTQIWGRSPKGSVSAYVNGNGEQTPYGLDESGLILSIRNPLGQTTSYTRDSLGRPLTETRPDGGTTGWVYGSAGPVSVTDPLGQVTAVSYNAVGLPVSVTDPRGKTTTFGYDSFGDLASVTDPLQKTTTFEYDAMGRRTKLTDPFGHQTSFSYGERGRLRRVTLPDASHQDFTYDLGGRRTSITDPLGRVTKFSYDAYGKPAATEDPLNGVTTYGYDLMSQLTRLTDARGKVTEFNYDAYGRLAQMTYPSGAEDSYEYDLAGRLVKKTDRRGAVATYSYDGAGRLTAKNYSHGTPAVTYSYDPVGRLLSAANETDTLSFSYDLSGQPRSETSSRNGSTVASTYDPAGNRLTVSIDGTLHVAYAYDDSSRVTTITRGASVFALGYDDVSRRTSLTYPNAVSTDYTYDALNRITRLKADLGATPITEFQYAYDAAGNRTRKQQLDYTEDYSYDPVNRLTGVERTAGLTGIWHYEYDAAGNRLQSQQDNTLVTTFGYNDLNQAVSGSGGGTLLFHGEVGEPGTVTVNGQPARLLSGNVFEAAVAVTPGTNTVNIVARDAAGNTRTNVYELDVAGQGASFSYDASGNLTQKVEGSTTWTYEWNAENQLTRVLSNGNEVARFKYDPVGRRVEKVAGAATTAWTYDGEDILRETSGGTTLKYIYGPGIDEPLAREDGTGAPSYFHADGLGSLLKTTNAAGAVIATRRYDAFGNLELGATNGYAYTGREWDPETNLYYYRARYYDPKIGRFITQDPIGLAGGINFYAYVENNPVNWTDPFGLQLGGPNCSIGPAPPTPTPSPTPQCLGELVCPCGTKPVRDFWAWLGCVVGGGNVPTVGTAAGGGMPQTGMNGASQVRKRARVPNLVPPRTAAKQGQAASAQGGLAGVLTAEDFCTRAATFCVPE